jgi:hypothetical protein
MWPSALKRNALPSRPGTPDRISVGGREVAAGSIPIVPTAAAPRGFAVPLKGGDAHDVVQNGQELIHGSAPLSTD